MRFSVSFLFDSCSRYRLSRRGQEEVGASDRLQSQLGSNGTEQFSNYLDVSFIMTVCRLCMYLDPGTQTGRISQPPCGKYLPWTVNGQATLANSEVTRDVD